MNLLNLYERLLSFEEMRDVAPVSLEKCPACPEHYGHFLIVSGKTRVSVFGQGDAVWQVIDLIDNGIITEEQASLLNDELIKRVPVTDFNPANPIQCKATITK